MVTRLAARTHVQDCPPENGSQIGSADEARDVPSNRQVGRDDAQARAERRHTELLEQRVAGARVRDLRERRDRVLQHQLIPHHQARHRAIWVDQRRLHTSGAHRRAISCAHRSERGRAERSSDDTRTSWRRRRGLVARAGAARPFVLCRVEPAGCPARRQARQVREGADRCANLCLCQGSTGWPGSAGRGGPRVRLARGGVASAACARPGAALG